MLKNGSISTEHIQGAMNEPLGQDGFLDILRSLNFQHRELDLERLEEELPKYSNAIRLQDDLTMILIAYAV